jgi:chromosome segregation ATPase
LSSERDWYRDQYDALDALVEAMQTDNGWLEYRLQVVRDAFLDQGAQAAKDAFVVERVTTALLERDEALQKAREDLAAVRAAAAEFETELASTRAQLQQDCATLEGARSWQSQAEGKAKEAEQLRADLEDRVTALVAAGGAPARAGSTHEEARAALERERVARKEAQGQLQREHVALEEAQATLKLRDLEITWLSGELVQEGVSYEELRQANEEKDASILELQQAAEAACAALETEKKKVQGELPFPPFTRWLDSFGIRSQFDLIFDFQACGRLSGTQRPRHRPYRWPTTPAGAGGAAGRFPRDVPGD